MPLSHISTTINDDTFALLQLGEPRAQRQLYDAFAPKMYALCLRYSSGRLEAEDMLQEGFIKVFQNIHLFRNEGSLEGWMRRIFVTTVIENIRKRTFWQKLESSAIDREPETELSGFEYLSLKDLLKMIQGLSDGYRTVFNLYVIEGYGHAEIAKLLNISEGTSKSQLSRAKQILQKTLLSR